jgi:ABC-2 type transport system permease protein
MYIEVLKMVRIPGFSIPILVFPILIFAMVGLPQSGKMIGKIDGGLYYLAALSAYAVMSAGLFSFGVSVATERAMGWHRLLRTSPLNVPMYFAAKIAMAAVFALVSLTTLVTFFFVLTGTPYSLRLLASMVLLIYGMVPFAALGLWLGYTFSPNTAVGLANLIFLPLAFLSGLFVPIESLPNVVQWIAPLLPSYHVAQLGWTVLGGVDAAETAVHALWVGAYSLVFLGCAVAAYKREESRTFQ